VRRNPRLKQPKILDPERPTGCRGFQIGPTTKAISVTGGLRLKTSKRNFYAQVWAFAEGGAISFWSN